MEGYPPSYPPPARKSTNIWLWVLLLVGIPCCLFIGLIGFGAFKGFQIAKDQVFPIAGCALSMEAMRDAVLDYANDHKGTLPKAEKWMEQVKPYYKKHYERLVSKNEKEMGKMFSMVEPEPPYGCKFGQLETGIAFNSKLSEKKLDSIEDRYGTILLFEVEKPQLNAHQAYVVRPRKSGPVFMMGERREWLEFPIAGGDKSGFSGNGVKIEVHQKTEKPKL